MALFFGDDEERFTPGVRKVGFPRYREVLEKNWKDFMLVGFLTLLGLIPFGAGMVYAILSSSLLVAALAGVIGGLFSGPGIACMYDLILRRLRNDEGHWSVCCKRSMKQNWKASLLPGVAQCVFLSILIYSGALHYWGVRPMTLGTLFVFAIACIIFLMVMTLWWCQTVLFEQTTGLKLKNALFFILFHFSRALLCGLAQFAWWMAAFLFLPWTGLLVPFLSVWYILYLAVFLLYRYMDQDFGIEDQIRQSFPGGLPKEEYRP